MDVDDVRSQLRENNRFIHVRGGAERMSSIPSMVHEKEGSVRIAND